MARGGALATPAARLFSLAGLGPLPASVKEARSRLGDAGLMPAASPPAPEEPERRFRRRRRDHGPPPALELRGVWFEIEDGPPCCAAWTSRSSPGERVALMGRNGAGKSTLLRLAKGLAEPTRGRIERAGEVALLLQNPGDYLIHEHAVEDAGGAGWWPPAWPAASEANPRDLSGGERQRLALEVVLGGGPRPRCCSTSPRAGWTARASRRSPTGSRRSRAGAAVVVATHDTEFAAAFADRVVLMGQGVVIADGPPAEVLGGGWHFSTEVARALGGAALTPEDGARVLGRELVG